MSVRRGVTRTAEVEPFSVAGLVVELLDARVTGPYPLIMRFEGRDRLARRLGEGTELHVEEGVSLGQMVLVRRDEF